jgi:hypothetical protein
VSNIAEITGMEQTSSPCTTSSRSSGLPSTSTGKVRGGSAQQVRRDAASRWLIGIHLPMEMFDHVEAA